MPKIAVLAMNKRIPKLPENPFKISPAEFRKLQIEQFQYRHKLRRQSAGSKLRREIKYKMVLMSECLGMKEPIEPREAINDAQKPVMSHSQQPHKVRKLQFKLSRVPDGGETSKILKSRTAIQRIDDALCFGNSMVGITPKNNKSGTSKGREAAGEFQLQGSNSDSFVVTNSIPTGTDERVAACKSANRLRQLKNMSYKVKM